MDRPSFSRAASAGRHKDPATALHELQVTAAQIRRLTVQQNRLDLARNRDDKRQWVQDRRARTRQLIELGGLVQKAGLVELVDDDRATLLGAFLELATRLHDHGQAEKDEHQQVSPADLRTRWRRLGLRAFDADEDAAETIMGERKIGQPGVKPA